MSKNVINPSAECRPALAATRTDRNFFLDVATGLVLTAMAASGALLAWVLPPRRSGGRGLTWLGMDRHDWGDVHLAIGVLLVALIALHVVLHASWVKACWTRCLGTWRSPRTWAVLAMLLVILLLPFVVPPSTGSADPGRHGQGDHPRAGERSDQVSPRWQRAGRRQGAVP